MTGLVNSKTPEKKIIEKNIKIIIVTSKTYIICVYMCVCYVCIYIYK